jgi:hypothetical protein
VSPEPPCLPTRYQPIRVDTSRQLDLLHEIAGLPGPRSAGGKVFCKIDE